MKKRKEKIMPEKIEETIIKTARKFAEKIEETIAPEKGIISNSSKKTEKQIGVVSNYFEHVSAAAIKLQVPLKVGDTIRIKGGETDVEQKIISMQIDHKSVTSAKKGDEIGILVKKKVHKGYKVFKA